MPYIVIDYRKDTGFPWYVAARPGWMRCADGSFARDGSFKGGPEWTRNRNHALEFKTRRSAARVQGKCPGSTIQPA